MTNVQQRVNESALEASSLSKVRKWLAGTKTDVPALETKSRTFAALMSQSGGWNAMGSITTNRLISEGYCSNPIVFRAVNLITQNFASIDYVVKKDGAVCDEHPSLKLVRRPNPTQDQHAFFEEMALSLTLTGNLYIKAVTDALGKPCELYVLNASYMRVIPGQNGFPSAYEYTVNGVSRRSAIDPNDGTCSILHIKLSNPKDHWHGLSPLEPARFAIDLYNKITRQNLAVLKNGARPLGLLMFKNHKLENDQRARLEEDLKARYEDTSNAGRTLILEGHDFDWKRIDCQEDVSFPEGKNIATHEIAHALGIPEILMRLLNQEAFATYREARKALFEETIFPLANKCLRALNRWLMPMLGDSDACFEIDEESVPALATRLESLWKRTKDVTVLTVNEQRAQLGFEPIEGGDRLRGN